jgi:tetratricopeptide (TPR) repeat protein
MDADQAPALYAALGQFKVDDLPTDDLPTDGWQRFQLILGYVAEGIGEIKPAEEAYYEALQTSETQTKVEAYYRLARLQELCDPEQSLGHYQRCLTLLETLPQPSSQLTEILIHRSWILIARQDWTQAEADLSRAQSAHPPDNLSLKCDLYNAWGEWYYRQDHLPDYLAKSIEQRWQAWLIAKELGDETRTRKIYQNIAAAYATRSQENKQRADLETALERLAISQTLAREAGDKHTETMCYINMGCCYFWLGDYDNCIAANLAAESLCLELDARTWLGDVCFNLTEAYNLCGNTLQALHYYHQSKALATEGGNKQLLKDLDDLYHAMLPKHLPATITLTPQQIQALAYTEKHGSITNRAYRTLTGLSPSQARRHLQSLVALELLSEEGDGRATRYSTKQPETASP